MARFLKPLVRSGGYYPSRRWTPLVYPGGYTTANGGEEPAPPPIEKTITGNPIHILDALAKPTQALSVKLEPVQDLHGYSYPWPAGGGVNLLDPAKCSTIGQGGAYGLTVTHDQATAIWTISGTPTSQNASLAFNFCTYSDFSLSGKGYQVQAFPISGTPIKNVYGFRNEAESRIAIIIDTVANPTVNMTFKVSVAATAQTAWSPYSNVCPISGHSSVNVIVSPTLNKSDGTTYPIPLGQTVYGGTLDVLTGVLTVDRAVVTFDGSADETWTYSSSYAKTNTAVFYTSALTDAYYPDWDYRGYITNLFLNATRNYLYSNDVECMGFTGSEGVSAFPTVRIFKTRASNETEFRSFLNNNPIQFCYKLATPQTYQLTPQQVELLLGENNIWSDGEMTLTYLADGNASDEEALNILLGGRYVNNHSEDEPTDREALNIVLGGNER